MFYCYFSTTLCFIYRVTQQQPIRGARNHHQAGRFPGLGQQLAHVIDGSTTRRQFKALLETTSEFRNSDDINFISKR